MTPAVALERPPSAASSPAPASLVRWVMTERRSLRSSSGRPGLVGPVEDQAERGRLHVVQPQGLTEQHRAEARHGGPQLGALAVAAEGHELDGHPGRLPVGRTDVGGALGAAIACLSGHGDAGQVALDVGEQHRHAGRRELLGDELQRLGLAGAGRAGDEAVPIHHRERQAYLRVGDGGPVDHDRAERDRRAVARVRLRDVPCCCLPVCRHAATLGRRRFPRHEGGGAATRMPAGRPRELQVICGAGSSLGSSARAWAMPGTTTRSTSDRVGVAARSVRRSIARTG